MKVAWFPIVFLVCGIPWPGLVYSRVAGPLHLTTSKQVKIGVDLTYNNTDFWSAYITYEKQYAKSMNIKLIV